jgi:hypothetical protein
MYHIMHLWDACSVIQFSLSDVSLLLLLLLLSSLRILYHIMTHIGDRMLELFSSHSGQKAAKAAQCSEAAHPI